MKPEKYKKKLLIIIIWVLFTSLTILMLYVTGKVYTATGSFKTAMAAFMAAFVFYWFGSYRTAIVSGKSVLSIIYSLVIAILAGIGSMAAIKNNAGVKISMSFGMTASFVVLVIGLSAIFFAKKFKPIRVFEEKERSLHIVHCQNCGMPMTIMEHKCKNCGAVFGKNKSKASRNI